ncbi:hypothetical protein [Oerskovia sp. KBS0722]|uniref:hypothetical protein n=1 Tax=Oerskovia sp. KBS0722 TaxID=1179673 RepID=UPI00110E00E6|nr:hypothetical protein [Oerskovia sp. KBS0722]QDW62067.1 hypothetical protein FFI11_005550 [Oerskovia sp. KBS0722]
MTTNVVELISDFFALRNSRSFWSVPGSALYELGEEVQKLYSGQISIEPAKGHRSYLGGWPSANLGSVHGDLLLTSLLYTDQIVVRDPICDWFAPEQYTNEHMISARPGFLGPEGIPNVRATRTFMAKALDRLEYLRPLIDRGIVVLAPGELLVKREEDRINQLREQLSTALSGDMEAYARRFGPSDLATEDNVRGLFAFVGGERNEQLLRAQGHAIRYFAREYAISTAMGATYTAPFRHEMWLASEGLGSTPTPSGQVSSALLASKVPVFTRLSPDLIARVHDDDAFGAFRRDLHFAYQNAPVGDADALELFARDQDREILTPSIEKAESAASSGFLREFGVKLKNSSFGILAGLTVDVLAGTPGLATAVGASVPMVSSYVDGRKMDKGSLPIWTALVKHQQQFSEEVSGVQSSTSQTGDRWGIPPEPSMNVSISEGATISDWISEGREDPEVRGYAAGNYRPCDCGSGLKHKFCCETLRVR